MKPVFRYYDNKWNLSIKNTGKTRHQQGWSRFSHLYKLNPVRIFIRKPLQLLAWKSLAGQSIRRSTYVQNIRTSVCLEHQNVRFTSKRRVFYLRGEFWRQLSHLELLHLETRLNETRFFRYYNSKWNLSIKTWFTGNARYQLGWSRISQP